jgi:cytochrome P450
LVAATLNSAAPKARLIDGHFGAFMRDRPGFLTHCSREYGDIVPLRFGPKRLLLVSHPELAEQILVDNDRYMSKPYVLSTSRVRLDAPPSNMHGIWSRPLLAQTVFHRSRMDGYGEIMVATTERVLDSWIADEPRDVLREMTRLAYQIVTSTLFGVESEHQADAVGAALGVVMNAFVGRLMTMFLVPEQLPTPGNLRLRRALRELDEIASDVVRRGRAASGGPRGLMALAPSEEGDEATETHLRDEAMTFLLAGHETVALTLTWIWWLLAQHPEVEQRLGAELDDVLGVRPPTNADVPRLDYTRYVVSEALRLYPPIWAMARTTTTTCRLGVRELPAGTNLVVSQWVIQRDPRFYADPDEFKPERWADGMAKQLPRCAFFPFGGGARGCIGSGFAMVEATLLLATIARRFRLASVPGPAVSPLASITLRPAPAVVLAPRKRAG